MLVVVPESTARQLYPKYPYPRPPPPPIPGSPIIRIPSRVHTASSTTLHDEDFMTDPRASGIFGRDDADTPDDVKKLEIPKRQGNGGFGRRIRLPTSAIQRDIMAKLDAISERSLESGRMSRVSTRQSRSASAAGSHSGFLGSAENVLTESTGSEEPVCEEEDSDVGRIRDGVQKMAKEAV